MSPVLGLAVELEIDVDADSDVDGDINVVAEDVESRDIVALGLVDASYPVLLPSVRSIGLGSKQPTNNSNNNGLLRMSATTGW